MNRRLSFEQALEAMEFGWVVSSNTPTDNYCDFYGCHNCQIFYLDPFSTGYPSLHPITLNKEDLSKNWYLTNLRFKDYWLDPFRD